MKRTPLLGGRDEQLLDLSQVKLPELTLEEPKVKPEVKCDECGVQDVELKREKDVFGQPFWLCGPCFNHVGKNLIPPLNEKEHPLEDYHLFSSWARAALENEDRVRAA